MFVKLFVFAPQKIWSHLETYTHTGEYEVALFPSEVGAFSQGAQRSDVQSPGAAVPVPLQVLPGLL